VSLLGKYISHFRFIVYHLSLVQVFVLSIQRFVILIGRVTESVKEQLDVGGLTIK
jgi:hypothetical protein